MSIEANTKNVQQLVVNQLGVANGQITEPYDPDHRYNIADGQVAPVKLSTGYPSWNTSGVVTVKSHLIVNGNSTNGGIEVNKGVTGDGVGYIDLHSSDADPEDFDARLSSNQNGLIELTNKRNGQDIEFKGTNSEGTRTLMKIKGTDGATGIGTSDPQEKLHVAGNIRVHSGDTLGSNDQKRGLLQLANSLKDSTATHSLALDPNEIVCATDLFIRTANAEEANGDFKNHHDITFSVQRKEPLSLANGGISYNKNVMKIKGRTTKEKGEVNIGCDSQTAINTKTYIQYDVDNQQAVLGLRHVNGGDRNYIKFVGGSTELGNIRFSNNVLSLNTNSDYRLKEDIVDMESAVEKVKQLKPRNFNWKSDGSNLDGFIAHELAEVCPQAVDGEKDAVRTQDVVISEEALDINNNVIQEEVIEQQEVADYQTVDQTQLIPILTKALQEALAKIESLEARVDALENA